jgi:hypothetical protein
VLYDSDFEKNVTLEIFPQGSFIEPGPSPPDLYNDQIGVKENPKADVKPIGTNYGDCVEQPAGVYSLGETVTAR